MSEKNKNNTNKSINVERFFQYKFYDDKIQIDFQVNDYPCAELVAFEFATASYENAALLLFTELEHYSVQDTKIRKQYMSTLYLPAMFCFRHYIELQVKSLYMWYFRKPLSLDNKNLHILRQLFEELQKKSNNKFTIIATAIEYIEKYEKFSTSHAYDSSYFRYLANKNYDFEEHLEIPISDIGKIKNYIIEIDFRTKQIKQNDWLCGFHDNNIICNN